RLLAETGARLPLAEQRRLIETVTEAHHAAFTAAATTSGRPLLATPPAPAPADEARQRQNERMQAVKAQIQPMLMERIDVAVAARLTQADLEAQVGAVVADLQSELKLQLNGSEQARLVRLIVDDMVGLG